MKGADTYYLSQDYSFVISEVAAMLTNRNEKLESCFRDIR